MNLAVLGSIYLLCQMIRADVFCDKGQYLSSGSCRPCPKETFMPFSNHRCLDCKRCSNPDHVLHETVLRSCTPTTDALIGCEPGYFRENDDGGSGYSVGECTRCSVCELLPVNKFRLKPCGPYKDTVCSAQPGLAAGDSQ